MNKFGTLITAALLSLGVAAGATAADMPKSASPMAADSPATSSTAAHTQKPAKKHKKHKKHKKTKSAPTTAK